MTTSARTAEILRETKETKIRARLALDGTGTSEIATGIGFLDHMLDQLARHSLIDIELTCAGDLQIDGHHTTEDCGIALGQALAQALGDKAGIRRYGEATVPMDETLTRCALDLSGRPFLVWHAEIPRGQLGTLDSELIREWFQAFAQHGGITLHLECFYGVNAHHMAESAFKALAQALRRAVEPDLRREGVIPSTKGSL